MQESKDKRQTGKEAPHLDRWHYLDYRDGRHDDRYIEWKYFNFTQDDLAGYFVYYILDPELGTKVGGGRLLARVFKKNSVAGLVRRVGVDRIQFDPISAGVSMDGATIAEKTPYHYLIRGDFADVSWSLDYRQKAPTIASFTNVNTGVLKWEKMNWLIKMPSAEVRGEVRLGGEKFAVSGRGYSDTNWGEMMPFFSRYEWGQCGDGDTSLVFGILYGLKGVKRAYFYMTTRDGTIALEDAAARSEHTAWTRDETTGLRVPAESVIVVENGEYKVRLFIRLIAHDTLGLKVSSLLPKVVVSEQVAEYRVAVEKNGAMIREFRGKGFREWSKKTWRSPALLF